MALVVILLAAQKDLLEQAAYYDAQSGETLGNRFLAACEASFERIAAFPESGVHVRVAHPKLERLFEKHHEQESRLSMRRIVARSNMVSDVCTMYS